MNFEQYRRHDATGLAQRVSSGEVTPTELLRLAAGRAEETNSQLNAINRLLLDRAERTLSVPLSGPFAGVPFLVKDLAQDVGGEPTSMGSLAFAHTPVAEDSTFVRRADNAGLVLFGKTNTPELGLKGVTENRTFGATRNPWDRDRTPGGSSGGAAAAVAGGIVPMAGANDGGGSIRIPAAYCGLFGLRPGRGRVPVGPRFHEIWEGASSDHVLTRSVRDSAHMLDILAGPDTGAPFHVAPPERPYSEELQHAPGRLRIAFSTRSPLGAAVDPACRDAVEKTARQLEALGHTVEEAEPAIDGMALARCYLTLYFGQVAAMVTDGRPQDFELDTRALAMLGRALTSGEYVRAHQQWNHFGRTLGHFFQDHDLYLTPTTAALPARIGELETPRVEQLALRPLLRLDAGRLLMKTGVVDKLAFRSLARTPFTQLANLTGTPAMSVPLHRSTDGLPVGSQFMAPVGGEGRLLRLAAQLEQAHPWWDHLPPG
ncbi:amidase [Aquisalimonas asiatica]|uniref:Amidase n=1 Tax=Aquisalimonas asiatica TaxID=406100 RepID=A0A1H8TQP8_9GAMM|nr:amidase [Aquisalimonas asiatica]SEO92758.1 amidase [Aquisalimonas asiatica]